MTHYRDGVTDMLSPSPWTARQANAVHFATAPCPNLIPVTPEMLRAGVEELMPEPRDFARLWRSPAEKLSAIYRAMRPLESVISK